MMRIRTMDIQIQFTHVVKQHLDPEKSAQVKLQIKHLHGTETRTLRLHAQYFALFFIFLKKISNSADFF